MQPLKRTLRAATVAFALTAAPWQACATIIVHGPALLPGGGDLVKFKLLFDLSDPPVLPKLFDSVQKGPLVESIEVQVDAFDPLLSLRSLKLASKHPHLPPFSVIEKNKNFPFLNPHKLTGGPLLELEFETPSSHGIPDFEWTMLAFGDPAPGDSLIDVKLRFLRLVTDDEGFELDVDESFQLSARTLAIPEPGAYALLLAGFGLLLLIGRTRGTHFRLR